MHESSRFVITIITASRQGKLIWKKSSSKGSFSTKVDDTQIEILPPLSFLEATSLASSLFVNRIDDLLKQEKDDRLDWRIAIYNSEGKFIDHVTQESLNKDDFRELLMENSDRPIIFLYKLIKDHLNEDKSNYLKHLSDKIADIELNEQR